MLGEAVAPPYAHVMLAMLTVAAWTSQRRAHLRLAGVMDAVWEAHLNWNGLVGVRHTCVHEGCGRGGHMLLNCPGGGCTACA